MKHTIKKFKSLVRYAFVRGISSILTISIFGLFVRRLPPQDLVTALSFTLVFGFFASLNRIIPSFAAGIQPNHSLQERLSLALVGYKSVLLAQIFLTPVFIIVAFRITDSLLISLFAAMILMVLSFDFDLSRAANAQEMIFPPLFLVGSFCALAYFELQSIANQRTAFVATLIQWVPVTVYSGRYLLRVGLGKIGQTSVTTSRVFSSLLIVSFDGLVLNLPMMPFITTSAENQIEVAILLRNFISSLFMLPFLIFLTNRMSILEGDQWDRHKRLILFIGIVGSSVLAFFLYNEYFCIISGSSLSQSKFWNVLPLTFGFASYYTQARYINMDKHPKVLLAISMFTIISVALATLYFARLGAAQVILLQALSFLAMTVTIASSNSGMRSES